MTITEELMPFEEAMKSLAARGVLPTSLDSQGLRQLGAGFHRQNFTSAKTLITDLLDGYKKAVEDIINPVTQQRADRVTPENPLGNVSTGLDLPTARLKIKQLQESIGMVKGDGSIKDLTSDARINLVLQTNRDVAQGAGWFIQGNDPDALDAFPAQELIRVESRKTHRDWPTRWRLNAQVVGDVDAFRVLGETGRMIARKDSRIWQALGDGEDGSTDTLGNPFPPFAFNSGMDVRDISYSEALLLKLVTPGEAVRPSLPSDLSTLFGVAA